MMDAIMAKTTIDLPEVIVAGELDKMMAQMKYDIERMGVTFEDYVRHAKKTEDDMRKEVTPDAEKRAKYQLILNKIAEVEEIKPDMKEAEARVDELLKEHPEANRQRALIYVVSNMLNQAVFDLLENPKS
jgi:trigger factor